MPTSDAYKKIPNSVMLNMLSICFRACQVSIRSQIIYLPPPLMRQLSVKASDFGEEPFEKFQNHAKAKKC